MRVDDLQRLQWTAPAIIFVSGRRGEDGAVRGSGRPIRGLRHPVAESGDASGAAGPARAFAPV